MKHVFEGTGPGPIAADGCPVELYRRAPAMQDLIAQFGDGKAPSRWLSILSTHPTNEERKDALSRVAQTRDR